MKAEVFFVIDETPLTSSSAIRLAMRQTRTSWRRDAGAFFTVTEGMKFGYGIDLSVGVSMLNFNGNTEDATLASLLGDGYEASGGAIEKLSFQASVNRRSSPFNRDYWTWVGSGYSTGLSLGFSTGFTNTKLLKAWYAIPH